MREPVIEKEFVTECDICHEICNDYAVNGGKAWCITCVEKENRELNGKLKSADDLIAAMDVTISTMGGTLVRSRGINAELNRRIDELELKLMSTGSHTKELTK